MSHGTDSGGTMIVVSDRTAIEEACRHAIERGYSVSEKKLLLERIRAAVSGASNSVPNTEDPPLPQPLMITALIDLFSSDISTIVFSSSNDADVTILKNGVRKPPKMFQTIDDMEHLHIKKTLEQCGWCCKTAARNLGIDRSTLYRKMKKYGLKRKRKD